MTEEKHNPSTLWTGNFIKIIVVNFFIFFSFHMLLPTLPIFVKSIGGQDSIVGLITGLFTISALLIRPFAGLLLDRIGRRSIFWTGLALFILATFSYSLFTAVTLVLLFRFIHGFGWGAASTASTTISMARRRSPLRHIVAAPSSSATIASIRIESTVSIRA